MADIERASLRAWPALEETSLGNWRLRFSKGFTKRANSVSIIDTHDHAISHSELLEKIAACEQLYHDRELATIFRLVQVIETENSTTTAPTNIDRVLASRNYRFCDASLVLIKKLDRTAPAPTSIHFVDMQAWLAGYQQISGTSGQAEHLHTLLLKGVKPELLFALAKHKQHSIACALGVLDGALLGLFDIATHPDFRKQGFARALVHHLCARGFSSGAKYVYLQVQEDNCAALALYAALGFSPAYRYGYRIEGESRMRVTCGPKI